MEKEAFYTLKGYTRKQEGAISPTMEDYLEMISRLRQVGETVRVNSLAARLNVTPPSSSKMVSKLKEQGYVDFEHYGIVTLTEKGRAAGAYLLHRHAVLQEFFSLVNRSDGELELVEQIEHFIGEETIANLQALIPRLRAWTSRPES